MVVTACVAALATAAAGATTSPVARPHVTNRCPTGALPLRQSDLPALRRVGIALGLHGVRRSGNTVADYRGARTRVTFPTFFTGYVRHVCARAAAAKVAARTADVTVTYPRITWSASLHFSIFLVARTPHGLVGWAQMH